MAEFNVTDWEEDRLGEGFYCFGGGNENCTDCDDNDNGTINGILKTFNQIFSAYNLGIKKTYNLSRFYRKLSIWCKQKLRSLIKLIYPTQNCPISARFLVTLGKISLKMGPLRKISLNVLNRTTKS